MKRGIAGVVVGIVAAASVVAIGSTPSARQADGSLHAIRVAHDVARDVSAPLSTLAGHPNGEADADQQDPDQRDAEQQGGDQQGADQQNADQRDGGGDVPTRGGGLTEAQRENLHRPHYTAPHVADGALQTSGAQRLAVGARMPSASVSFDGINSVQSGCGCLPPDPNGAVGPNHYVQTVNTAIAVYDKSGHLAATFPKPMNSLWSGFNSSPACRDNNDGDPVVLYDRYADRWIVTQFAIPGFMAHSGTGVNYECVAVSTTGDPTGSYFRYAFPNTTGLLNDYPKLGIWPDGLYVTYNEFSNTTGAYAGAGFAVFDLNSMLTGSAATVQQVNVAASTNEGGALPPDLDGATLPVSGTPAPFIEMQSPATGFASARYLIRLMHVDWATPANTTLAAPKVLSAATFDQNMCNFNANCIPQKGTSIKLDAISDRAMFRAQARVVNGHVAILVNGTVDANGADRAAPRWAQLTDVTTNSPSIVQQGTYSPDASHRWMASIAADKNGDIALAYSKSSSTMYPALAATGRLAGDAAGSMTQGETTLFAGTGAQTHTASRWGDYSDLTVDPADDCTFWYTNEYYATVNQKSWKTRVVAFSFPSCTGAVPVAPSAPQNASATAGDAQAVVSFAPPASDGGASITSYTVTASPGGATASGASSPITVTGLTNGTQYTFTVTATNSAGTGPASAPSNAVTPLATVTSGYQSSEYSFVQAEAATIGDSVAKFQHDAVAGWIFIYGLSGSAPGKIMPSPAGTTNVTSSYTPSELAGLDSLRAGWQQSRPDAQRTAADGLAYLIALSG